MAYGRKIWRSFVKDTKKPIDDLAILFQNLEKVEFPSRDYYFKLCWCPTPLIEVDNLTNHLRRPGLGKGRSGSWWSSQNL